MKVLVKENGGTASWRKCTHPAIDRGRPRDSSDLGEALPVVLVRDTERFGMNRTRSKTKLEPMTVQGIARRAAEMPAG